MDKFPEMGVFGQKELEPGVFFGAGQFNDCPGGRKGLAQVKVSLLMGPGVDEQGGPGISLKIGKFSRSAGGGKDKLPAIGSGGKGHQAGMRLSLAVGS